MFERIIHKYYLIHIVLKPFEPVYTTRSGNGASANGRIQSVSIVAKMGG